MEIDGHGSYRIRKGCNKLEGLIFSNLALW